MIITLEELQEFLRRNGVTFDDCEEALGEAGSTVEFARHSYGTGMRPRKNGDMPHKRVVIKKHHAVIDRRPHGGCWVSAWVWVDYGRAAAWQLTKGSQTV